MHDQKDPQDAAVGLSAIAYALPARRVSVEDLAAEGNLISAPAPLRSFGFEYAHVADDGEEAPHLAFRAAEAVLTEAEVERAEVGALVYATAIPSSAVMTHDRASKLASTQVDGKPRVTPSPPPFPRGRGGSHPTRSCLPSARRTSHTVKDWFRYPATWLQYELGLERASVFGVHQQACVALFGAIRAARGLLAAEPDLRHVLCVSADRFPPGASREVMYNVISDGACAVLVSRDARVNRILDCYQVTKGYYWDTPALGNELLAAYFPTARAVILEALRRAGLRLSDVDWIVPHNVSLRGWEILLGMLGITTDRLYAANIGARGHCIAADNLMNLHDMQGAGLLRRGQRLLLFNFGFGASWSTIILEH